MIRSVLASVDWSTLAAMAVVLGFLEGCLFLLVRARLERHFVTRRDHGNLDDRVFSLERSLIAVPSRQDFLNITDRLANGQAKMEVLSSQSGANGRALERVETQLDTITKVLLEREKNV